MEALLADFGQKTWLPLPAIGGRLVLATVLGAVIGFEREWREQPAGLRTHMLICLAAALAAILTVEMTHTPVFQDEAIRVDPIRLIEAVTAGVAFLAAGMIVFSGGKVKGLTTGAGMWLAGSIGLACGLGYAQVALMAAVLGVLVLSLLRLVEKSDRPAEPKDDQDAAAPAKRVIKPKP